MTEREETRDAHCSRSQSQLPRQGGPAPELFPGRSRGRCGRAREWAARKHFLEEEGGVGSAGTPATLESASTPQGTTLNNRVTSQGQSEWLLLLRGPWRSCDTRGRPRNSISQRARLSRPGGVPALLKSTNHSEVQGHCALLIGVSLRLSEACRGEAPLGPHLPKRAGARAGTWALIGGGAGGARPRAGPDAGRAHVCVTVVAGEGEPGRRGRECK